MNQGKIIGTKPGLFPLSPRNRPLGTFLAELVLVIFFSTAVIISVAELAARENLKFRISKEIVEVTNNFASAATFYEQVLANYRTISAEEKSKIQHSEIRMKEIDEQFLTKLADERTREISQLNGILSRISTLISIGAQSEDESIYKITEDYLNIQSMTYPQRVDHENTTQSPQNIGSLLYFADLRSDHLLAISIVCSAAIGAMIFIFRSRAELKPSAESRAEEKPSAEKSTSHKNNSFSEILFTLGVITSGLATGFVVFLALKGGQNLFILSNSSVQISANPYTSALAGLLAGLFSDKAYKTLSKLVDELLSRVEHSSTPNQK